MVYPPDVAYTPPPSPEPIRKEKWAPPPQEEEEEVDGEPPLDEQLEWIGAESQLVGEERRGGREGGRGGEGRNGRRREGGREREWGWQERRRGREEREGGGRRREGEERMGGKGEERGEMEGGMERDLERKDKTEGEIEKGRFVEEEKNEQEIKNEGMATSSAPFSSSQLPAGTGHLSAAAERHRASLPTQRVHQGCRRPLTDLRPASPRRTDVRQNGEEACNSPWVVTINVIIL